MKAINVSTLALVCAAITSSAHALELKPAQINSDIKAKVQACRGYEYDMYSACIQVSKFTYADNATPAQVLKAISESSEASGALVKTTSYAAAEKLLRVRLNVYMDSKAEFIGNTGPYEDSELEAINQDYYNYGRLSRDTLAILKRQMSVAGVYAFLDEDTYWAPSVNASAVWVVNPAKRTVYQFVLGDLDG